MFLCPGAQAFDTWDSRIRSLGKPGSRGDPLPLSPGHSRDKKDALSLLFVLSSVFPSFFLLAQVILYSFVQSLGAQIGTVEFLFG